MPEAFTLLFALAILYWFYIVEAVLVLLAYRFSRTNPDLGRRWFVAAEQWLGRLARRRGLSVVAIGVLALVGREEELARDLGHRPEHALVLDPPLAQLGGDHALAPRRVLLGGGASVRPVAVAVSRCSC